MLERVFQAALVKDLKSLFPGCIVLKNDANKRQGIPDLLILFNSRWAALEVKADDQASKRPNQDHYINKMNDMSYAAFITPTSREQILNDLQQALGT